MKKITLILFGCFVLHSMNAQTWEENNVITTTGDDVEMNEAILEARETFDEFMAALTEKKSKADQFAIKYPFKTNVGYEHIWLGEIKVKKGKLKGVVDNDPDNTIDVKIGQEVEINPEMISDWMYFESGKLKGGRTMVLLINRMPEEQKKAYKKALGIE